MKKLIFAVVLALLVLAALGTTVFADNGPHGGFSNTTADCASCHRIHSAQSSDGFLLVEHNVYASCVSCHGDGVGAYTDVKNGVYTANTSGATWPSPLGAQGDAGQPLFGGGFEKVAVAHVFNGMNGYDTTSAFPTPSAATSTHSVEGLGAATGAGTIWGAGAMNASLPGAETLTGDPGSALECTSCHDPHGRAGLVGTTKTASYRLLRYTPNFSDGYEKKTGSAAATFENGVHMTEITNYWYTINSDITKDPSVAMFRLRYDTTAGVWTNWGSYITQKGDAAGRSYTYLRPAIPQASFTIANGATPGTLYSCAGLGLVDPATLPNPRLPQASPGVSGVSFDYNAVITACGSASGTAFDNSSARTNIGNWCATCHDRYAASSARSSDSGDAHYAFRHTSVGSSVSCVDCHAAHGTNAVMTNTNAEHPGAALTNGSILLKTDERSVCLKCHGTSVNFNYVATPIP